MALQLRGSRVNFISKLTGVFIALFALFIQPVVALDLPAAFAAPVINEIMPNPVGISDADGEWIELKNDDSTAVDISNWTIAGATVPSGESIAANGLFLLCKTAEATTECDAVSTTAMKLGNIGERTITLKDESDNVVDEFTYNKPDDSGVTDGESLEVVKENGEKKAVNNATDAYQTDESTPRSGNTGTPGSQNRAQATSVTVGNGGDYDTLQKGIDAVADNGTVTLISNITSSREILISKPLVIEGGNHVLTTTTQFVANDKDNSVIEINSTSAVTVNDLVIDGAGGHYLNGINTFKSAATLNSLTLKNNAKYGIVVNGSAITVNNITTSSNAWGGVNVDVSSTSNPALLTVNGRSAHNEPAHIYMDNTARDVKVKDTNSQYTFGPSGLPGRPNDRVYRLIPDTQGPAISSKNPAKNEVIGGNYKVSAVVTDPSGVDDGSVYAKFRDDSGKEYVHYLARESGTDIFSKVVNTATIINKKVGKPSRVSFFARDSNGTSRSSVSDGVVIDNAGPAIGNKTPRKNEHIRGMYKVSAVVTDTSGVDDSSVYARFRDNTGKEYTHYLTRESGTDVFSKMVDTTQIGDGNTNPSRVSFFARDSFATSRSSVSDGVVIDNTAPRVSNIVFSSGINGNISGTVDITFDLSDASKIDFGQTKLLFADGPSDKFRTRESSKYTPVLTGGNSYKVTVNTRDFVKQGHSGAYNLQFNLRDELGNNTSTKPAEFRSLLVDNAGPSIASKKPGENATINGNKYVASAIVTDPSGVDPKSVYVRFRDDSDKEYTTYLQKQNEQGLYSAEIDTSKIGDGNTGPNRVSFFARDGFGTSRSSVSDGVRIDNAAPVVSNINIVGQDDKTKNIGGVVTVTFDMSDASGIDESRTRVIFGNEQATDKNHAYEVVKNPICIENGAVYNCEATFNTKSFVRANHTGVYTLGINPYDKLGNQTSMKPAEYQNLLVDNSGPGFTLISPESGSFQNGGVQLVFEANDDTGVSGGYARLVSPAGKTVQQRDIQPTSDDMVWTADFDTAGLTDGEYTIDVRPIDTFGTARYNKNIGSIVIDRVAPDSPAVEFTADNDGDTVTNNGATDSKFFTFNLDSTADDLDHYELKYWNDIAGSTFKENTPWNKKDIPSSGEYKDNFTQGEGTHYFSFITCDVASNCSENPTVFEVTYDNTAPVAPNVIDSTSDSTPTLNGSAEANSNVVVSVNGNEYPTSADENGMWAVEVTDELTDGDYSVVVYSTDATGNRSGNTNYLMTVGELEPAREIVGGSGGERDDTDNATVSRSTPSTPGQISPLSRLAFSQGITGANGSAATGSVLGAATTGSESEDDDNGDVLGTNNPSTDGSVKNAAVAQSPEGWKLFGIAWYWILLLLAALAGLWWFLVARRNAAEDENL